LFVYKNDRPDIITSMGGVKETYYVQKICEENSMLVFWLKV